MGADKGDGVDEPVGRESELKEVAGERGVERAERKEEVGEDCEEGVTSVERKAVRRAEE